MQLNNLPNDVLLEITKYLDPITQVCLGLTCHQLNTFVIGTNGKSTLYEIVLYERSRRTFRYPHTRQLSPHIRLMTRLQLWVPKEYSLCWKDDDKYVKNSKGMCTRCKEAGKKQRQKKQSRENPFSYLLRTEDD